MLCLVRVYFSDLLLLFEYQHNIFAFVAMVFIVDK